VWVCAHCWRLFGDLFCICFYEVAHPCLSLHINKPFSNVSWCYWLRSMLLRHNVIIPKLKTFKERWDNNPITSKIQNICKRGHQTVFNNEHTASWISSIEGASSVSFVLIISSPSRSNIIMWLHLKYEYWNNIQIVCFRHYNVFCWGLKEVVL
jgi:hypothetical protein